MSLNKICKSCAEGIKDDVITYYTREGEEILAPMEGKVKEVDNTSVKLKHEPEGCDSFVTIITNIKPNNLDVGDKVDGLIGKANGFVTLTILKSGSKVKPQPYFDGSYCKKKKENEKNEENKKSPTNSDITYDPYAIAAAPFYGMKFGKAGLKKIFTEEINRIKTLMK